MCLIDTILEEHCAHKLQEELRNDAYLNSKISKERSKKWHDQMKARKNIQKGDKVLLYDSKLHIFVDAHTIMEQRMTRTESILAHIQEHLGLPPIPFTPPKEATVPALPGPPPATLTAALADPALAASAVPPAASAALPVDHPLVPTQSKDDDKIPPPVAT